MKIAAGRRDVGVAEGGLDFRERRAAVDGVRTVGVAKPMGRDGLVDAGRACRALQQSMDGPLRQGAAVAGSEHGIIGQC